ncbi:hypothetical protein GCM10025734_04490 [Kitasatospora paranensis]
MRVDPADDGYLICCWNLLPFGVTCAEGHAPAGQAVGCCGSEKALERRHMQVAAFRLPLRRELPE